MKQLTLETINALYPELNGSNAFMQPLGRTPPIFLMHIFRGTDNAVIDTLQYAIPLPPWFNGIFGPTQMHWEVRQVNGCIRICFHHENGLSEKVRNEIEKYIKNNSFLQNLNHNEQGSWQGYETGEIIWKDIPVNEANPKLIVEELSRFASHFSGFLFMQIERVLDAKKRTFLSCR